MREDKLIKSATDRQMPDFDKIREDILNHTSQKQKPKIITLKPTKLISAAVIIAFAVTGTIVAVANQNGGLFSPKSEETITAPVAQTESTSPKVTHHSSNSDSKKPEQPKRQSEAQKIKNNIKSLKESGVPVEWLYILGKAEGYNICYAGNKNSSDYSCDYIIGDYTFSAVSGQYPYGLGIYVCGKKESYTLSDAYEAGIFDNFSAVASLIGEYGERDIGIDVMDKNPTSENFRDYFGGQDILSMARLKSTDNYELYFNIPSSYSNKQYEKTIDNYTFYVNMVQQPYEFGLYVVCDNKILTLDEALNSQIIDMQQVFDAVHGASDIPYNWSLFKSEEEQTVSTENSSEESATDGELS